MSIKKVIDCIKTHKVFLITAHQNLEGDALGSEIAFCNLLKKLGKSAIVINQDPTPQEYSFIKGSKLIRRYRHNMKLKFDVLVILDCSDKSRCGRVASLAISGQPVVNIDHHVSNDKFGDVNWVQPTAASVSEMIYQLYKAMRIKIDVHTAKALYVGILTDTGSFRYINTTSFTHQVVAKLLKFDLDKTEVTLSLLPSKRLSFILSLPNCLKHLLRSNGKFVYPYTSSIVNCIGNCCCSGNHGRFPNTLRSKRTS